MLSAILSDVVIFMFHAFISNGNSTVPAGRCSLVHDDLIWGYVLGLV